MISVLVKKLSSVKVHDPIISTGVLIVGLNQKMQKQGVRIFPQVEDGQELSSYMCLYSHVCFKIGVN